jgi:hypothetical protein
MAVSGIDGVTPHEITLAKALGSCSYMPGSSQKRFAKDISFLAEHSPERELSLRQRHYMELMAWRYRRQLPESLVPKAKPPDLPKKIRTPCSTTSQKKNVSATRHTMGIAVATDDYLEGELFQ